jgi:hypothetical protein
MWAGVGNAFADPNRPAVRIATDGAGIAALLTALFGTDRP